MPIKKTLKIIDIAGNEIDEPVEHVEPVVEPVVEPKTPKERRKEYMKNYMKNYVKNNKQATQLYQNSRYYLTNTDMPKDYMEKYNKYACLIYKAQQDLQKIKSLCPEYLEDIVISIKD
tara:strand:+ start:384 stop:737 length:354 start_codon:yes stop_codon:yes gene_type:complete